MIRTKWKDMVIIFFGCLIAKGRRGMEEAKALAKSGMSEHALKLKGRRKEIVCVVEDS